MGRQHGKCKGIGRSGAFEMPRGPRGEKRPSNVIGAAIMVPRIATGEIDEQPKILPELPHTQGGQNERQQEPASD